MRSRFAKHEVWAIHGWRRSEHPKRVREWLRIEWPEVVETPSDYWLAQLGDVLTKPKSNLTRKQHSLLDKVNERFLNTDATGNHMNAVHDIASIELE